MKSVTTAAITPPLPLLYPCSPPTHPALGSASPRLPSSPLIPAVLTLTLLLGQFLNVEPAVSKPSEMIGDQVKLIAPWAAHLHKCDDEHVHIICDQVLSFTFNV